MNKKIGIVWIREDFRIIRNSALAAAAQNHEEVIALYIFKKNKFKDKQWQNI